MANGVSSLDDWVSTNEAAKLMECSISNVWQLIHRGKLPNCIRIGNMIFIPKTDINNHLEMKRLKKEARLKKFVAPKRDILKITENKTK